MTTLHCYNGAYCKIASFQLEASTPKTISITRRVLIDLTEARLMTGDNEKESPVQLAVKSLRVVRNSTDEPPGELETLFQAHHERVFRAAYRITGSPADA